MGTKRTGPAPAFPPSDARRVAVLAFLSLLAGASGARAASVVVDWDANAEPDLAGYRLYYGSSSLLGMTPAQAASSPAVVKVTAVAAVTSLPVAGLSGGRSYFFRVTAYNAAGEESGFSQMPLEISLMVPAPPPDAPAGLAAAVTSSSIRLSWLPGSVAGAGVYVYRADNGGASRLIATAPGAGVRSYDDTSARPGNSYLYTVRAYDAGGTSPASNAATAAIPGGTGVGGGGGGASSDPREAPADEDRPGLLSPGRADGWNDAVDFGPDAREADVFDAGGRRVRRAEGSAGVSWDGKDALGAPLPSGLYIAKITRRDGSVRYRKLLVAK